MKGTDQQGFDAGRGQGYMYTPRKVCGPKVPLLCKRCEGKGRKKVQRDGKLKWLDRRGTRLVPTDLRSRYINRSA